MPLDAMQTGTFLVAAMLITLSPGPDNLMIVSLGIARGRRQGMAFGLGCALGCLSHTALAALGISALIMASPVAFTILKAFGGLYLMWLGVKALRSWGGSSGASPADTVDKSLKMLFGQGLLANAINPKVIVFFLAFLPQFVMAERGAVAGQIMLLGLIFTVQSALLFGTIGHFSGRVGEWLSGRQGAVVWLDRAAGSVFIILGLKLLATG